MLNVDGGPDVDAGIENFTHILPAFAMAQAGGVGMGEFVHQEELWAAGEGGVEIEFFEDLAAIGDFLAGQHLDAADRFYGAGTAVRFDDAGDDVEAGCAFVVGGGEHFPGFADAGGGAEENL